MGFMNNVLFHYGKAKALLPKGGGALAQLTKGETEVSLPRIKKASCNSAGFLFGGAGGT